jgi:hypothetical protein
VVTGFVPSPQAAFARSGGQNRHQPRPTFAGAWEVEMEILIVAIGALAAIWVLVLWGSRFIGPR